MSFTGGLFDCGGAGSCLAAFFCVPCYWGRVAHRLEKFPRSPDESDFSYCNSNCCIEYLLMHVGCQCIPIMQKRKQQREKFGIEGDGFKDFMVTCCCTPCAMTQMTKDLKHRSEQEKLIGDGNGYKPQGQTMVYEQQIPAKQ